MDRLIMLGSLQTIITTTLAIKSNQWLDSSTV